MSGSAGQESGTEGDCSFLSGQNIPAGLDHRAYWILTGPEPTSPDLFTVPRVVLAGGLTLES